MGRNDVQQHLMSYSSETQMGYDMSVGALALPKKLKMARLLPNMLMSHLGFQMDVRPQVANVISGPGLSLTASRAGGRAGPV